LLRDGKIIERGTYNQLMAMRGEISNLIKTANNQDQSSPSTTTSSRTSTIIDSDSALEEVNEAEMEEAQEHLTQLQPIRSGTSQVKKKRKDSNVTLRRASTASFKRPRKVHDEEESPKHKQSKEFTEQGKVKWDGKDCTLRLLRYH
jgi:hypothetical protein